MRIAVVSDVHGNRTAFEAVLADLRDTAPDLILHGGDLADGGGSPTHIIDQIRDLKWPGVVGNTDEMLFRSEALAEHMSPSSRLRPMFEAIADMAAWTRERLGGERLDWLRALPAVQTSDTLALVHASPGDPWQGPLPDAGDAELGPQTPRLAGRWSFMVISTGLTFGRRSG